MTNELYWKLQDCNDTLIINIYENRKKFAVIWGLTPLQINSGWCHEWASLVKKKITSATHLMYGNLDSGHSFVKIDDRFYDAEALDGVDDWRTLPIFKRFTEEGYQSFLRSPRDVTEITEPLGEQIHPFSAYP